MTAVDRIPEMAQHGWNEGYIAGEAERLALATANCDLRSDLRALQAERAWLWRIAEHLGAALLARGVRPADCDALDEWVQR